MSTAREIIAQADKYRDVAKNANDLVNTVVTHMSPTAPAWKLYRPAWSSIITLPERSVIISPATMEALLVHLDQIIVASLEAAEALEVRVLVVES